MALYDKGKIIIEPKDDKFKVCLFFNRGIHHSGFKVFRDGRLFDDFKSALKYATNWIRHNKKYYGSLEIVVDSSFAERLLEQLK